MYVNICFSPWNVSSTKQGLCRFCSPSYLQRQEHCVIQYIFDRYLLIEQMNEQIVNIILIPERLIFSDCFQLYHQSFLFISFISLSIYTLRKVYIFFSSKDSNYLEYQLSMRLFKASIRISAISSLWPLHPLILSDHLVF